MDADPCSITVTTRDALAMSPPICRASNVVACAISGLGRVTSSYSIMIAPGYDMSVVGISTSASVDAITTS
jgi:hypothetical protein